MADKRLFDDFLNLSSELTGFGTYQLRGTGQADLYLSTLDSVLGQQTVKQLLDAFRSVISNAGDDGAAIERGLRRDILSDEKLGPVARRVIKMWYVGIWYELPREWREAHGENDNDRTFVVSPNSYVEGLLWPTIGANPSGAKPLGYAMWATPPRIEK